MKKAIWFLAALSMVICAVSCEKKQSAEPVPEVLAETERLSFKEARITMAEDFSRVISLDRLEEQVLVFGERDGSYTGYVTDKSFDEHTAFTYSPKENETVKSACLCKFGKTAVLTLQDSRLMLRVFNRDGVICNEYDLGEHQFDLEMGAILMAAGEDFIINLNNETILSVLADGTVVGEVNCKGGTIYGVSKNNEDAPAVILSYGDETKTAEINGVKLENEVKCSELSSSPYALCGGSETYSLMGNFNDGLYGLQGEKWVKLTDYGDNTFAAVDAYGMLCLGENEFAVMTSKGFIMLSERDISEIRAKKVITIASWEDTDISADIRGFNSSSDDYRMELKLYGSSQKTIDERMADLRADILAGDAPDMMVNNRYYVTAESFGARESLFADIYDLIDSDPEIARSDFVEGYLEALEFRGKLLSFAPGFTVDTLLMKERFAGGLTDMTYEEMMDIVADRPDGMGIIPYAEALRRAEYMLKLVDYCSFVDYEKGECHFDSPEFVNAIKLTQKNELGKTEQEFQSFLENDEYDDYPQERYYLDNRYLIKVSSPFLSSMRSLHSIVSGEFNEPVSFAGYASYDGIGTKMQPDEHRTFSVLRSCEYPEGAWEFIRETYLNGDFYDSYSGARCFPALEKYLAEKIDAETKPQTYEDGENVYTYSLGDDETAEYPPFSEDEASRYGGIVREAARHKRRYDNTVYSILIEELTAYFEGERSAEDAAEIIQNRVGIYVSEMA